MTRTMMKPKALDCCRSHSFSVVHDVLAVRGKLRCSQQSRAFGFICRTLGTVA